MTLVFNALGRARDARRDGRGGLCMSDVRRLPFGRPDTLSHRHAPHRPHRPDACCATPPLIDPFGRAITYLRVSVTDRCDFRCTYCMSEDMTFLPRRDLLTLEELDRLCSRLRGARHAQAAHHRRRAAGAARHPAPVPAPVAPSRSRRARRTDADHQRHAARHATPTALADCGVKRDQRLARHARPRQVPGHHPPRRPRAR